MPWPAAAFELQMFKVYQKLMLRNPRGLYLLTGNTGSLDWLIKITMSQYYASYGLSLPLLE